MTEREYEQFKNFIRELLYERMTEDDYNVILSRLGSDNHNNRFKTVCHNEFGGGYNLAFMPDSKTFFCHSGCQCSYSLLSLIKKRREILGLPNTTYQCLKWLCSQLNIPFNFKEDVRVTNTNIYKWQNNIAKYLRNSNECIELKEYDKKVLKMFPKIYHTDWLDYGISEEVLDKYNIRWYDYRSQIIIPCYKDDGTLIGIRTRNTNPNVPLKYFPLELLDGTQYNFPTNEVFFGENYNFTNVERTKSVLLVEAEKTVMKYESWYGAENNICLGLYGSRLNKTRINKLLKLGVKNFYIALDSDFTEIGDNKDYNKFEKKVLKIYNSLKPYSDNIYVVYNNLGFENCYKYSITDYTKEQFEMLWQSKERIEL